MRSILVCLALSLAALMACTASQPSPPVAPSSPLPTSASSSDVAVPDLLGLDAKGAERLLTQAGLALAAYSS
jgi:hypothetical protein